MPSGQRESGREANAQRIVEIQTDLDEQQKQTKEQQEAIDGIDSRLQWVEYKQDKWEKSRSWVLEGFPSIEQRYWDNVLNVDDRDFAAVKKHLPADLIKDIGERLKLPADIPEMIPGDWPESKQTAARKLLSLKANFTPDLIEMVKEQWKGGERKKNEFVVILEPEEGKVIKTAIRGIVSDALFEASGLRAPAGSADRVQLSVEGWMIAPETGARVEKRLIYQDKTQAEKKARRERATAAAGVAGGNPGGTSGSSSSSSKGGKVKGKGKDKGKDKGKGKGKGKGKAKGKGRA